MIKFKNKQKFMGLINNKKKGLKMTKLNANQKKVEFIKLVGEEHTNQINSSNNRNSCLLIQAEAMKNKEFEYKKHYQTKDESGNNIVSTITLEKINAFKNADITEFVKGFVEWIFFEKPKGKWNSKDNKNEWQIARDSSICSIAIYKASSNYDKPIIADNKLNKKGKILVNAEFITEYMPTLNKDEQKTPMYLSFAEMKKVCLSWFNDNKASDGTGTKLKGLSADIERLIKSLNAEMEDDFTKRHDEKIFSKMGMLYTTMNTYHATYKNLFPKNYEILTGKKVEYTQPKKEEQKKSA